jgi:hypothetical protein
MCTQFLSENQKGREFGVLRRRWEYNIKMDLKNICNGIDGIHWLRTGISGGLL